MFLFDLMFLWSTFDCNGKKKKDQMMQFLRGLNDQYANVCSIILLMDLLPLIIKVFSYVVQQERQTLGSASVLGSLNLESRDYSQLMLLAASSTQIADFVVVSVTLKVYVIKSTTFL